MDHVDIEVLLAHVLNKDRSWVLAHPEYVPTKSEESRLKKYLDRRNSGEPVAYIVGEKEFYGRRFNVDPRVLIPRPSTEGLIDFFLEILKSPITNHQSPNKSQISSTKSQKNPKFQNSKILDTGIVGIFIPNVMVSRANHDTVVDIGTGSGCIAITLACEVPDARIIATDISADALDMARENAKRHGVEGRIEFRQGSLLEPILDIDEPFMIVSNPPYVSEGIPLPTLPGHPPQPSPRLRPTGKGEGILHEPPLALFAGHKGIDVLIPLIKQAHRHPYCRGIFLECQEEQLDYLPLS